MLGTRELVVVAVFGLINLALPLATIGLLVAVYRMLSAMRLELRRMNKNPGG